MGKTAKRKVKKGQVEGPKSKAETLAEELVVTSSDTGFTTDEEMVVISAGKPPKGKFFRVHPTVRAEVRILKMRVGVKDERYVVTKSIAGKLDYVTLQTAFLCTTLDGIPFLWLAGTGDDTWSTSARKIAVDAMLIWQRLVSHNASGTYRKRPAKDEKREPNFQGLEGKPFVEILMMAFDRDHIIDSLDHPIAQQVLSE